MICHTHETWDVLCTYVIVARNKWQQSAINCLELVVCLKYLFFLWSVYSRTLFHYFLSFQTVSLHYAILLILLIAIRDDDDWSTNNFWEELLRFWFLPCILHVLIGANVVRTFHSIFLASELEIACPCPGVDRDSVACMCCAVSRAWMNIWWETGCHRWCWVPIMRIGLPFDAQEFP